MKDSHIKDAIAELELPDSSQGSQLRKVLHFLLNRISKADDILAELAATVDSLKLWVYHGGIDPAIPKPAEQPAFKVGQRVRADSKHTPGATGVVVGKPDGKGEIPVDLDEPHLHERAWAFHAHQLTPLDEPAKGRYEAVGDSGGAYWRVYDGPRIIANFYGEPCEPNARAYADFLNGIDYKQRHSELLALVKKWAECRETHDYGRFADLSEQLARAALGISLPN